MIIEEGTKLDFDDVLIKPQFSNLASRSEVELRRDFTFNNGQEWFGIPIMSANMDTTGTIEVANVLQNHQMLTCLHKHYTVEELYEFFFEAREYTAYSMGISQADLKKYTSLKSKLPAGNIKWVCIDVANGYQSKFLDFLKKFRKNNPDVIIIAGNVCTAEGTKAILEAGADIVKIGIGPGSVCTTRLKTGIGFPQLSAIDECALVAHRLGGYVCGDGGCSKPADMAKAFGAAADFVMLGGMFAGHEESGGDTITEDGQLFKIFYGMSSEAAMEKHSGGVAKYRASEGKKIKIPFRGPIISTVDDILGSLRSTCTYVGAKQLEELSKLTTFIKVNNTHNKVFEGKTNETI